MQEMASAGKPQIAVRVINVENQSGPLALDKEDPNPDLIVAIGSDAARLARSAPRAIPVLDILIPRLLYEQLHSTTPGNESTQQHSALYIDQPLERQLNLCRLIVPNLNHVAVLYGATSQASASALETAAQQLDITLTTGNIPPGASINAKLDEILDNSQLLLALPDPDVFNRYTVSGLLLTAYHHNVPVIGFSSAYVKAGALSAVYSTPEQIGREAADAVLNAHTDKGWLLAPPRYHTNYSVALNHQVARSLNLKIPSEDELLRKLQQLELSHP